MLLLTHENTNQREGEQLHQIGGWTHGIYFLSNSFKALLQSRKHPPPCLQFQAQTKHLEYNIVSVLARPLAVSSPLELLQFSRPQLIRLDEKIPEVF